jgi:hypothetical protein
MKPASASLMLAASRAALRFLHRDRSRYPLFDRDPDRQELDPAPRRRCSP